MFLLSFNFDRKTDIVNIPLVSWSSRICINPSLANKKVILYNLGTLD